MKTNTFLALLLAAVVTWGCGSSDTTTAPAASPSAQKSGTVTFSVKFPTAAATKAFIGSNTNKVIITGYSDMGGWSMYPPLELTPANPTATVEAPEGELCFDAIAEDSAGMTSDHARTCGEVVAGIANRATLTFLGADWEFVNASNVATPLTLASATHGNVSLAGFRLGAEQYAGATKAAIDNTKPNSRAEYGLQFFSGTTTDALKFGPLGQAESESQFLAGATASTNYTSFSSSDLNLDVPANDTNNNWYPGERIAFILDSVGSDPSETITGSNGQSAIPTVQPYADSHIVDGSTLTGHFLELTMGATMPTRVLKTADVDCSLYWDQNQGMPARAAAISKAFAAKSGSATKAAPGTANLLDSGITVVYDKCESENPSVSNIGSIYTYTMTFSNVIAREFRAKAKQKGTSFILPPATITVNNAYVEYRTHENSANNRYVGWVQYTDNGQPVAATDLAGVQLFDPAGQEIYQMTPPQFMQANFLNATWNGTAFNPDTSGGYTGYFLELGNLTSLTAGDYTFKTELAAGQTIETIRNVGAKVELPVVLSSSMTNSWNADSHLTLSWAEPAGTFGTYRIILRKMLQPTGSTEIFYAAASPGTTSVTIPATLFTKIMTNAGITDPAAVQLGWEVQTRSFDANNFEIARGRSNIIPIVPPTTGNVTVE